MARQPPGIRGMSDEVDAALVSATETPSDTNGVNAGKIGQSAKLEQPPNRDFPGSVALP
jgi:hypothetical protein